MKINNPLNKCNKANTTLIGIKGSQNKWFYNIFYRDKVKFESNLIPINVFR